MNVIKVGILVGISVVSDFSLTSSVLDLYSTIGYNKSPKEVSTLTQIDQIRQEGVYALGTASIFSEIDDIKYLNISIMTSKDIDILDLLIERIKNSKPIPAEFSRIIDEDFWNLV